MRGSTGKKAICLPRAVRPSYKEKKSSRQTFPLLQTSMNAKLDKTKRFNFGSENLAVHQHDVR